MQTDDTATRLMDQIAEELHNGWWSFKLGKHYTLGPRCDEKRQHPHLVPWSAKSEHERTQDRYQAVSVMAMYRRSDPPPNNEEIARAIHGALCEFRLATQMGELPAHLQREGFEACREERITQAEAILPLLERFREAGGWSR
jgi:hypothetical protein